MTTLGPPKPPVSAGSASPAGHARVQALLRQAVMRGRVPQTMLFSGPEGVGKHTIALALAQAINCPKSTDGVACGRCTNCTRIARGQFSDVAEVDNGDIASISIKSIRERVLDLVGYRPFEGHRRVFIIDPADALSLQAQDALLKTLEEPPPATVLILISAYADSLRPTVLSRCRRVRFGALTDAEVAQVLTARHGMDQALARSRAGLSGGSVAQALALDGGVLEDDREAAWDLLRTAAASPMSARLRVAEAVTKHGTKRREREALGMRLAHVSALLRDLSAIIHAPQGGATLSNADREADLRSVLRSFPIDRVVAAFGLVARAQAALDRNASPKIVADWLAVGI
ncbi:MAG TPA: AAA family ATPase [Vicinamibacterales bacterium]|nr:AAA family ATPase [Vicinamibacterales bacterium]